MNRAHRIKFVSLGIIFVALCGGCKDKGGKAQSNNAASAPGQAQSITVQYEPRNGSTNVSLMPEIKLTFSEAVNFYPQVPKTGSLNSLVQTEPGPCGLKVDASMRVTRPFETNAWLYALSPNGEPEKVQITSLQKVNMPWPVCTALQGRTEGDRTLVITPVTSLKANTKYEVWARGGVGFKVPPSNWKATFTTGAK